MNQLMKNINRWLLVKCLDILSSLVGPYFGSYKDENYDILLGLVFLHLELSF